MSFFKHLGLSAAAQAGDSIISSVAKYYPEITSEAQLRAFNEDVSKASYQVGQATTERDKDKQAYEQAQAKAAQDMAVAESLTSKGSASADEAVTIAEKSAAAEAQAKERLAKSDAFLLDLNRSLTEMRNHAQQAMDALRDKQREGATLDNDIAREKRRADAAQQMAGMSTKRSGTDAAAAALDRENEKRRTELAALQAKTGAYDGMTKDGANSEIEAERQRLAGGTTAGMTAAERLARLKGTAS